jgi:APA family basic amino acid/polyamine antiporter
LATSLVLSGTFEQIIQMTSIAMFVTGTLTVLSMFVLRRKRPEMERPYRATFYPILPGLYLCLSLFAVGASFWQALRSGGAQTYYPLIGICLFVLVFVGHFWFQKRELLKKRY